MSRRIKTATAVAAAENNMEFEKLRMEANKLRRMKERIPLKDVYQLHGNGFSRWANYEIKIMREMATFGLESLSAFSCILNNEFFSFRQNKFSPAHCSFLRFKRRKESESNKHKFWHYGSIFPSN